jgi:hypothetical protein
MKILSRKTIASLIAGTFIIAGAASPFIVQAADTQASPSSLHDKQQKQQINPEEVVKRMSDTFGIDQAIILKYYNSGMKFNDIGRAAFLAKASGKSIEDVMSKKTADNKWGDVAKSMGITKEQMQVTRQNMAADHLNKKIGLDKKTALNLLQQGYHSRDIGMASELAKNTKKPINDILSLKKINNTWSDVAKTLGVDEQTFKNDLKEMGRTPGHKGYHEKSESGL